MITSQLTAFIFARGGSKGIPNKNLKLLNGKPLIYYSISQALRSKYIQSVVVSTDSIEIAEVAKSYGALVPFMRPDVLATDTAAEWKAWQHAINTYREIYSSDLKLFISVPCTSPLRLSEDLDLCIEQYFKDSVDIVLTGTKSKKNPYFNIFKKDASGYFSKVISSQVTRRQDAPTVYDLTTVCYVGNPSYILTHDSFDQARIGLVEIPYPRSIDIDDITEFNLCEFYMKESMVER